MRLTVNGKDYEVEWQTDGVTIDGASFKTAVLRDGDEATVKVAGRPYKIRRTDDQTVLVDGRPFTVAVSGQATVARQAARGPATSAAGCAERGAVVALMPGTVLALRVKEGEAVAAGTVVLILEAMKMQNEIKAPQAGTVTRIAVAAGQTVNQGEVMIVIA